MSWKDQGRQYHEWFGHGTAADKDAGDDDAPDDIFAAANLGQRIDALGYGVAGHLSPDERRLCDAVSGRDNAERLRTAMTAWAGASSLGRSAFRDHFVDPRASDETIDALRAAAEGARTAQTHADLRAAGAELAGAMRRVGLDRWGGFLRDAAERATTDAGSKPAVVAQASQTGVQSDVTPAPGAAAPVGRYVADNPRHSIAPVPVGDGECVTLVKQATGAPASTSDWRKGVPVQGNLIKPGTAIATFDSDGRYGNHTDGTSHAAIYLRQDDKGIYVIDQWNIQKGGKVIGNQPPHEHFIPWDAPGSNKIGQGKNYYVVQ